MTSGVAGPPTTEYLWVRFGHEGNSPEVIVSIGGTTYKLQRKEGQTVFRLPLLRKEFESLDKRGVKIIRG